MSLQRVIAAPFKQAGGPPLTKQQLVVGLSLHREWFSPDQAKQVVDRAASEGLLNSTDTGYEPTFAITDVEIPRDFTPDESILTRQSPFEQILERVVDAGLDKRESVAKINRLQRDRNITIESAAALYTIEEGIDIAEPLQAIYDEFDPDSVLKD